jgi:uncharacterized protein YpuA (DUF1002 family)
MNCLKKLGLVAALWLMMLPAYAAMVTTPELLVTPGQSQLISSLQSQEIQQQLIEMGVDPVAAMKRVKQMTEAEIASLQGKINQLPAGAGIGTLELLLIIIILILLI